MNIYSIIGFSKEEVEKVLENKETYYLSYPIKKPGKKTLRWIDAPQQPLKQMQSNILYRLLYTFKTHPAAVGYVKKCNVKVGANRHVGSQVLLCMDFSNFFPSINYNFIYKLILFLLATHNERHSNFEFNRVEDVHILSKLLSYKQGLPQGSPASPAVANLFCKKLDKNLDDLAKSYDLIYTRYADDLTFSGNDKTLDMYQIVSRATSQVKSYGLKVNTKKTRILRPHRRMSVTGVVVNEKLNTPRKVRRNLRAQLHNLKTTKAILSETDIQKLRGKIEWIRTLHPVHGERLLKSLGEIISQSC